MKKRVLYLFVAALLGLGAQPVRAELNVVATMSSFADLAKTIGGPYVTVSYVAPPTFNPHFIEPRPSDVLKVKRCDLFIHGGLDLEAWRGPLVDAAGNPRVRTGGDRELDLSRGIKLLEVPDHPLSRADGDIHIYGNPHYWPSPVNGAIIAREIAEKLREVDPDHADAYDQNLSRFLDKLNAKMKTWKARLKPYQGVELVGYHNEWIYFMEFAGLRMDLFLEPKPGIPPGPQHLARVEAYIKEHDVPAIVSASYQPKRSAEQLAQRSGARLVLLCQNVGEAPGASDYLSMVNYNVEQLAQAMQ